MKQIIIWCLIFFIILVFSKWDLTDNLIPNDAIRLRVIANSNSLNDQKIKTKVKDELQKDIYMVLKETDNIEEARDVIRVNLDNFDDNIKRTLVREKYDIDHILNFGHYYFPKKKYKGIVYEEGYYESVLVKLGKGEGDNWWCVLFPPLCLLEASDSSDIEYKFFVKELLSKFIK